MWHRDGHGRLAKAVTQHCLAYRSPDAVGTLFSLALARAQGSADSGSPSTADG